MQMAFTRTWRWPASPLAPLLAALVAGLLGCHGAAQAACSRPISIAISGQGTDIIVDGSRKVTGTMAEVLDDVAQRSGCTFHYLFLPRARAISMFMAGEVDVLPAAVQTAERDKVGQFVQFTTAQVAAIGLKSRLAQLGKLDAALSGNYLVNVVRGHDYGPAFRSLVASLRAQRRLDEVVDPLTAAKKLAIGRADVVLMAPGAFIDATARANIDNTLQAVPVAGIPAFSAGIYLSRSGLADADRDLLAAAMADPAVRQRYWQSVSKRLPPWVLDGARPTR